MVLCQNLITFTVTCLSTKAVLLYVFQYYYNTKFLGTEFRER